MSRELTVSSEYFSARNGIVPIRWTAPEVLDSRKYTSASDVWALGILCGEVFDDGDEVSKSWAGESRGPNNSRANTATHVALCRENAGAGLHYRAKRRTHRTAGGLRGNILHEFHAALL